MWKLGDGMIITKTVSFFLPEEHEEEQEFREEHEGWTVTEGTGCRTYSKTTFYDKVEVEQDERSRSKG